MLRSNLLIFIGRTNIPLKPEMLHNILIYVLLASALITFLLDHLIDTLVIVTVVLINGLIGFIQEGYSSESSPFSSQRYSVLLPIPSRAAARRLLPDTRSRTSRA